MDVILEGIVGSHAYGLDTPTSDVDTLGVYLAPTADFLGLNAPTDGNSTVVHRDPDTTHHELGKFCRLALKVNPTITELLWLDGWTELMSGGAGLVYARSAFLSAPYVKNSYLGYATQQFQRIQTRESHDFSSDTKHRVAKHSRHLMRLLRQGYDLWRCGGLQVRVDDPVPYFEFGEQVQAGNLRVARQMMADFETLFSAVPTVLSDEPDTERIDNLVRGIRVDSATWL